MNTPREQRDEQPRMKTKMRATVTVDPSNAATALRHPAPPKGELARALTSIGFDGPPAEAAKLVRIGRRRLVRYVELAGALVEAYELSREASGFVGVVGLARYFDGARDGYAVLTRPTKRDLALCAALVAAL